MTLRSALAWGLALLGLAGMPAPAGAKDTLVIGVSQFPSSLHPAIDPEVIKSYVLDFAIRPVTAFDPDWKNSCLLCSELPTLENGRAKIVDRDGHAGMDVTLRLKPGMKWGDGVPVSSRDLEFTWKLGRDRESGWSNTNPWARAVSIEVQDNLTAVLHLDRVMVSFNQWDTLLPAHIEAPVRDKAASTAEYIRQSTFNRAPTTPGLWNGPYRIAAYESGNQVVLEPNPGWSGTTPGLRRIVIRLIDKTPVLLANLESGDVDMVAGEGIGLTINQVTALQKQHPDSFTTIFKPSLMYEHIDLQTGNPILADIRVRRALLLGIDRKTLSSRLFEGRQPVADSWVNPLNPMYSDTVTKYPYDPGRARALLAEAGWQPGPDGVCRNARGERLSLVLSTTAGNRLRELVEQVLQNQWKAACVDVVLKNEPPRTLFGETLKQRQYPGMVMYGWSSGVTEGPRPTLHSSQIPTEANNWGGSNTVAFANARMDTLIEQAESELDPARAKLLWAEMQAIYAEELPALPLYFRTEPHVVPIWLEGYAPTGHSDYSPLWSENWRPK